MSDNAITIYHGSNVVVEKPQIMISGFYKDFGYGFYCTRYEQQAKKWALTKRTEHIVTRYEYAPQEELNILTFPEMTDEWLDFVADCRRGKEHQYDIVELSSGIHFIPKISFPQKACFFIAGNGAFVFRIHPKNDLVEL